MAPRVRMDPSGEFVSGLCYESAWVAPMPFIVTDGDVVIFANHAALRVLGYADAQSFLGQGLDALLHPDVLPAARTRHEIVVSTSRRFDATRTKLVTASGSAAQFTVDIYPIEVNGRVLLAAEFDVSAWPPPVRKSPQAPQLGGLAGPLACGLLDGSSTPMVVQDIDTILYANQAACDGLGGIERAELEGEPILSIVHPDGLFSAIQRVAFVFAAHQQLHSVPTKLKCVDGRVLHVIADAYPFKARDRWVALLVTRSARESEDPPR